MSLFLTEKAITHSTSPPLLAEKVCYFRGDGFVDKTLVIPGISCLASFILALRVLLVVELVISGILSSIFFYLSIIYMYYTFISLFFH